MELPGMALKHSSKKQLNLDMFSRIWVKLVLLLAIHLKNDHTNGTRRYRPETQLEKAAELRHPT